MGGGWFLGALPIALQLIVWSHTIFGGTALTLRFAITSMIDTATTFTDRALQDKLSEKDAKRKWPGTDILAGSIGIAPRSRITTHEIQKAELENGLRKPRAEAALIELHTASAKRDEQLLENTSKRLVGVTKDMAEITKELGWEPLGGEKKPDTPENTPAQPVAPENTPAQSAAPENTPAQPVAPASPTARRPARPPQTTRAARGNRKPPIRRGGRKPGSSL